MRKIIFLDIDGVIATPRSIKDGMRVLTDDCQRRLGDILRATGADIVLTSSWRHNTVQKSIDYMNEYGFLFCDKIIGVTIRGYQHIEKGFPMSIPRGVEIKHWIDNYICREQGSGPYNRMMIGLDYNYVILDDDTDMLLEQKDFFINCDGMVGLTDDESDYAIFILNKT